MDDLSRIDALFKEKAEMKVSMKEVKVKKQKKKDKKKVETEDLLVGYETKIVNGVTIYTGIKKDNIKNVNRNVRFMKLLIDQKPLSRLRSSVLSADGKLSDILFNEEKERIFHEIPPKEFCRVIKVGCNFWELYVFPNMFQQHPLRDMIVSITALHGENITIGCYCQNTIDTLHVYELLAALSEHEKEIETFIKTYTHVDNLSACGVLKTKSKRIKKNLTSFFEFRTTSKDSIHDLQNIIETIMPRNDRHKCLKYVDQVIDIIRIFTTYSRSCICWNKDTCESVFAGTSSKKKKEGVEKRKKQGTGLYFNSQISFYLFNISNKNISKIKVFRTGSIQVPGIKCADMQDIIEPLNFLGTYWHSVDKHTTPRILFLISTMRNYTCHINDPDNKIILERMEDCLLFEKDLPLLPFSVKILINIFKRLNFSPQVNMKIFKYIPYSLQNIAEIINNPDKQQGLAVKFNKPIPTKENKRLALRILTSGKIKLDGGNSELELYEAYYWIQVMILKYWNEIIYNSKKNLEYISSDDEYESLYDSE